jgi:hypothetical protein
MSAAMTTRRALVGLAGLALALSAAGQALAQAAPAVPPELAAAMSDWGACRGRVVIAGARGSAPADTILADAMRACAAEEAQVRAMAAKTLGQGADAVVDRAFSVSQAQMRDLIIQTRAGVAPTDPSVAWGACVGREIRANALAQGDPETIINGAFKACADAEQKVEAYSEARAGRDLAPGLMTQARTVLHDRAAKLIGQMRTAQH